MEDALCSLQLCRICISSNSSTQMISIFGEDSLWKKITTLADVKIEKGDTLPQQVCVACAKNAISACLFKKKCEDADNFFRQQLLIQKIEGRTATATTTNNSVISITEDGDNVNEALDHGATLLHGLSQAAQQRQLEEEENSATAHQLRVGGVNMTVSEDGELKAVANGKIPFDMNFIRFMQEYNQQQMSKMNGTHHSGRNPVCSGSEEAAADDDEPLPLIPEIELITPADDMAMAAAGGNPTAAQMRGYQCPSCFQIFEMKQILKAHMQSVHGTPGPVYECSNCKKTYFYKRFLEKHVRRGRCVKKRRNQTRPMQCSDCHVLFPTGHHLGWHKRTGCPSRAAKMPLQQLFKQNIIQYNNFPKRIGIRKPENALYLHNRKILMANNKRKGRTRIKLDAKKIALAKQLILREATTTVIANELNISRTFAWRLRKSLVNGVSLHERVIDANVSECGSGNNAIELQQHQQKQQQLEQQLLQQHQEQQQQEQQSEPGSTVEDQGEDIVATKIKSENVSSDEADDDSDDNDNNNDDNVGSDGERVGAVEAESAESADDDESDSESGSDAARTNKGEEMQNNAKHNSTIKMPKLQRRPVDREDDDDNDDDDDDDDANDNEEKHHKRQQRHGNNIEGNQHEIKNIRSDGYVEDDDDNENDDSDADYGDGDNENETEADFDSTAHKTRVNCNKSLSLLQQQEQHHQQYMQFLAAASAVRASKEDVRNSDNIPLHQLSQEFRANNAKNITTNLSNGDTINPAAAAAAVSATAGIPPMLRQFPPSVAAAINQLPVNLSIRPIASLQHQHNENSNTSQSSHTNTSTHTHSHNHNQSRSNLKKPRKPNVFIDDEKYAMAKTLVAQNSSTMEIARALNVSQMTAWKVRDAIVKGVPLSYRNKRDAINERNGHRTNVAANECNNDVDLNEQQQLLQQQHQLQQQQEQKQLQLQLLRQQAQQQQQMEKQRLLQEHQQQKQLKLQQQQAMHEEQLRQQQQQQQHDATINSNKHPRRRLKAFEREIRDKEITREILELIKEDSNIQYWKVSARLAEKGYPISPSSVCQKLKSMGIHRRWKSGDRHIEQLKAASAAAVAAATASAANSSADESNYEHQQQQRFDLGGAHFLSAFTH